MDFKDIKGQEAAKRAVTVALAGEHNVLLYGCYGTGKTMFLEAIKDSGLLPDTCEVIDNVDRLSTAKIRELEEKYFVATTKTCPCGYYRHLHKSCQCTPAKFSKFYTHLKESGFLEWVDIFIELPPLRYYDMVREDKSETNSTKYIVDYANNISFYKSLDIHKEVNYLLEQGLKELGWGMREYTKIKKISRTVANLDGKELIGAEHISEAIQYRMREL
ncbi:MAG: ATP-binding protein [bacterium]